MTMPNRVETLRELSVAVEEFYSRVRRLMPVNLQTATGWKTEARLNAFLATAEDLAEGELQDLVALVEKHEPQTKPGEKQ
jgi:hypothetical protein